jgi:hypothetical protein
MTDFILKHVPLLGEKVFYVAYGFVDNAITRSIQCSRSKTKFLCAAIALVFLSGCAIRGPVFISGFVPIYPEQKMEALAGLDIKAYTVFVEVDSTQPELVWSPFPGVHETLEFGGLVPKRTPFVEVDPSKISNVTYELKVCKVAADKKPWEIDFSDLGLAYERSGITDNRHRIEQPLEPGTRYIWSVRSRFDLEGQMRLSEWTVINTNNGHFRNVGRPFARRIGRVPPVFALRFRTPGTPPALSPTVAAAPPDAVCGDKILDEEAAPAQSTLVRPKTLEKAVPTALENRLVNEWRQRSDMLRREIAHNTEIMNEGFWRFSEFNVVLASLEDPENGLIKLETRYTLRRGGPYYGQRPEPRSYKQTVVVDDNRKKVVSVGSPIQLN